MKSFLITLLCIASLCSGITTTTHAADTYDNAPITGEDITEVLNLNLQKFQINFEHEGIATMQIQGDEPEPQIITLDGPTKSATLMIYIERGPDSRGSKVKGLDTLNYWFSHSTQRRGSYITFKSDLADLSTSGTGKSGEPFTIKATSKDPSAKDPGYFIKITSTPTAPANKPPPTTPTTTTANLLSHGVYGGNSMDQVLAYEKWLGRPVDSILCTIDFHQWQNYRYSDWLSNTVYGARGNRRLIYDVPIIITGATYAEATTGAYDDHWQCLAQTIIANNPGDYDIVIRPSHEMNGEWFVWGVGGSRTAQIPDFITSWQRFHSVFRKVEGGARFRFSFSPSEGASDPRPMWPGDAYVDIIGYDVYWKPKAMGGEGWETNDAAEAWRLRITNGYNDWAIAGMHDFAKQKGKPFQIDEWGVWGPDAAPFIEGMAKFLKENNARAHTYWDSDAAYPGQLTTRDKDWPKTTQAFKAAFSK